MNSCIVLDIDETLIHASSRRPKQFHFIVNVNGDKYYVRKRPHLRKFLITVFSKFRYVAIWTAASQEYALEVISKVLTKSQANRLLFFWTREQCMVDKHGMFKKPLKYVWQSFPNLNKSNTVMIDNNAYVMSLNRANGVLVPDFNNYSEKDVHLMFLIWKLNHQRGKITNNHQLRSFIRSANT